VLVSSFASTEERQGKPIWRSEPGASGEGGGLTEGRTTTRRTTAAVKARMRVVGDPSPYDQGRESGVHKIRREGCDAGTCRAPECGTAFVAVQRGSTQVR
ncbi:MAG: hypothetical protein M1837_003867, partial [Sclerophora amabilis]